MKAVIALCLSLCVSAAWTAKLQTPVLESQKCYYNHVVYNVGDTFKDAQDCNTCYCGLNNAIACTKMFCLPHKLPPIVV